MKVKEVIKFYNLCFSFVLVLRSFLILFSLRKLLINKHFSLMFLLLEIVLQVTCMLWTVSVLQLVAVGQITPVLPVKVSFLLSLLNSASINF